MAASFQLWTEDSTKQVSSGLPVWLTLDWMQMDRENDFERNYKYEISQYKYIT